MIVGGIEMDPSFDLNAFQIGAEEMEQDFVGVDTWEDSSAAGDDDSVDVTTCQAA